MADPTATQDAADALWSYVVRLYQADGVADACLSLQDRHSADVPVLLYVLWLASRGAAVGAAEMARIEQEIAAWRAEVIWPLRAVRRRLKSGPPPAPGTATESLRSAVKSAELGAEKIELQVLAQLAGSGFGSAGPATYRQNLDAAMAHYAKDAKVAAHLLDPLIRAAEALQTTA